MAMFWIFLWASLAFVAYKFYRRCYADRKGLPPGPPSFPLVDCFFSFDKKDFLGGLLRFRAVYGDVYTLFVMGRPMVVVNGATKIRKYFESSEATAGRPHFHTTDLMYGGPNAGIVNATGERWREARRFSLHTLRDFGVGKAVMEAAIQEEAQVMLRSMEEEMAEEGQLDPVEPLTHSVISVVSRVMFGHGFPKGHPKVKGIREAIGAFNEVGNDPGLAAVFTLLSVFPALRHVPLFRHFGADYITDFGGRLFGLVDEEVAKVQEGFDKANEPANFIEAYLKEMADREEEGRSSVHMSKFQLSRIIGDFWVAGLETTVTTLSWAPVYMANYPDVQAKIHAELDAFYGGSEEGVSMAHRTSLPYTTAAVMELQRVTNIIPFNVMHEALEDMEMEGWRVKKGTLLMPQISSVLYDEETFPQPKIFRPERFLEEGRLKKSDSFVPFSIGKRACAGEPLARAELFIFFASLLRRFRVTASPLPSFEMLKGGARKPRPYAVRLHRRHK